MAPNLLFDVVSTDYQEREMCVAINGKRYVYTFNDIQGAEKTVREIQKRSKGQALGWIKKNCTSWRKIDDDPVL